MHEITVTQLVEQWQHGGVEAVVDTLSAHPPHITALFIHELLRQEHERQCERGHMYHVEDGLTDLAPLVNHLMDRRPPSYTGQPDQPEHTWR